MTEKQAEEKYQELLKEHIRRVNELVETAKASGTWSPGLDSNKELFNKLEEEMNQEIMRLKISIDSESILRGAFLLP